MNTPEIIDIASTVFTAAVAGFTGWLAWQTRGMAKATARAVQQDRKLISVAQQQAKVSTDGVEESRRALAATHAPLLYPVTLVLPPGGRLGEGVSLPANTWALRAGAVGGSAELSFPLPTGVQTNQRVSGDEHHGPWLPLRETPSGPCIGFVVAFRNGGLGPAVITGSSLGLRPIGQAEPPNWRRGPSDLAVGVGESVWLGFVTVEGTDPVTQRKAERVRGCLGEDDFELRCQVRYRSPADPHLLETQVDYKPKPSENTASQTRAERGELTLLRWTLPPALQVKGGATEGIPMPPP